MDAMARTPRLAVAPVLALTALGALAVLPACSGSHDEAATATTSEVVATTTAPTTSEAPTTTERSTTTTERATHHDPGHDHHVGAADDGRRHRRTDGAPLDGGRRPGRPLRSDGWSTVAVRRRRRGRARRRTAALGAPTADTGWVRAPRHQHLRRHPGAPGDVGHRCRCSSATSRTA